ncbi:MAG: hypothetical protein EOP53_04680 [Sphingobacteriales bacterium]|nr:MAG: hypothetical protein EOP53_04680 [Sphingobacteriales bacterium]
MSIKNSTVTSKELIQKIYLRLGKFKVLLLLLGIIAAAAMFIYAKRLPTKYNTRATVFALTAANESNAASSAISQFLGGGESPKSFSQEASINIVELATSRNTREAVAMQRLKQFDNKRIAELLVENFNENRKFFTPAINVPKDTVLLAAIGGGLLNENFNAKTLKSGILELTYTNNNPELLTPVTNAMIDKISQFYIDLKIKKAKRDYDFTLKKIDSLQEILDTYDRQAIVMANTTRFVPKERIEYSIPKENLINAKQRGVSQRDALTNNKEEALWRLQKATPIIALLDKPERPFSSTKPSAMMYGIVGFILGVLLAIGLLIAPILYKYIESEANKAVFGEEELIEKETTDTVTTTTA